MKKVVVWVLLSGLLGLAGTIVARNWIARRTVEVGVVKATGFPLAIGAVNVGLMDGQLAVQDLQLMNPPDFEARMFVDMPQFRFSYELGSFFRGVPHIREMNIDLKEVIIVKNAKGESNVQRLQGVGSGGDAAATTNTGSRTKFQLDVVHIHIGTVISRDYSHGALNERTMPLNVNVTYQNISDSTDITRLALMTIMSSVRLPDLGVRVADLQKGLGPVQNSAASALKNATEATKGLVNKLKTSTAKE